MVTLLVTLLVWDYTAVYLYWIVALLVCISTGVCLCQFVSLVVCISTGLYHYRFVSLLVCVSLILHIALVSLPLVRLLLYLLKRGFIPI